MIEALAGKPGCRQYWTVVAWCDPSGASPLSYQGWFTRMELGDDEFLMVHGEYIYPAPEDGRRKKMYVTRNYDDAKLIAGDVRKNYSNVKNAWPVFLWAREGETIDDLNIADRILGQEGRELARQEAKEKAMEGQAVKATDGHHWTIAVRWDLDDKPEYLGGYRMASTHDGFVSVHGPSARHMFVERDYDDAKSVATELLGLRNVRDAWPVRFTVEEGTLRCNRDIATEIVNDIVRPPEGMEDTEGVMIIMAARSDGDGKFDFDVDLGRGFWKLEAGARTMLVDGISDLAYRLKKMSINNEEESE